MHENAIFSPIKGGVRRLRPMLDPQLKMSRPQKHVGICRGPTESSVLIEFIHVFLTGKFTFGIILMIQSDLQGENFNFKVKLV